MSSSDQINRAGAEAAPHRTTARRRPFTKLTTSDIDS
jgi:hypothetical protein